MSAQPVKIKDKNSEQARMWPIITAVLLSILVITEISPTRGQEMDKYPTWSKVELDLDGPEALGMGEPNPLHISMAIAFTGPGDQE